MDSGRVILQQRDNNAQLGSGSRGRSWRRLKTSNISESDAVPDFRLQRPTQMPHEKTGEKAVTLGFCSRTESPQKTSWRKGPVFLTFGTLLTNVS